MHQFLNKTALELLLLSVNQSACVLLGQSIDYSIGSANIRKVVAHIRARLKNSIREQLVLAKDQLFGFVETMMQAIVLMIYIHR